MDNTLTCYTSTELTDKIKGAMYDIARGFVYIGFLLAECDYYHTYLEWGYKSIYDYAQSELGFKKSSVNNFINVCKTFSANYSSVGYSLPFSSVMKDTYTQYNYSQLVEMLSMSDNQRLQVTPDMTVRQIRDLKKADSSVDSSRRLEVVTSPQSFSDVDYLIPHSSDLRNLFSDIEAASLYNSDFENKDLFDIADYFFKSNNYVIFKKVN